MYNHIWYGLILFELVAGMEVVNTRSEKEAMACQQTPEQATIAIDKTEMVLPGK
jgi:hypothetical protein